MFSGDTIQAFRSFISQARKIAVLTHTHPDGDAVGASTAAWRYLAFKEKEAVIFSCEPLPDNLAFIRKDTPESADPSILQDCDLFLVLDLNGLDRLSDSIKQTATLSKARKILIDHHLNPRKEEFDLVVSDTGASSACEILYFLLKEVEGGIDHFEKSLLEALLCGMTTDTNNFDNSVRPQTLTMTSEILAAGVDRETLLDRLNRSNRPNKIQAFGYFIGQKLVLKGGLAYIVITKEDLDRFNLREGELEGLVNIPLTIGDIKVSVTAKEDADTWRISLRSKKGYTVNDIASSYFDGGGHAQASGGRLYVQNGFGTAEKVSQYIENSIKI